MSLTVTLSYEERIINALAHVKHKRTDDCITRGTREFEAIRKVLGPFYEEVAKLRRAIAIAREALEACEDEIGGYDTTAARPTGHSAEVAAQVQHALDALRLDGAK